LGTTVTNQNIYFQCKSRLNVRNTCYHQVLNLLSSCALKIKIQKVITLPFVLYGYETWHLTNIRTYVENCSRTKCWRKYFDLAERKEKIT